MMKHLKRHPPGIRLFFVLGLVTVLFPACCPTGAFEDNFGRFYTLVTIPNPEFEETMQTSGQVDTRDSGCGVWSIQTTLPLDPQNPISWVAVNPNPNPGDLCCYAFRFDGQIAGSGCLVILGEYQNVGGKCEGSGPMFLQTAQ